MSALYATIQLGWPNDQKIALKPVIKIRFIRRIKVQYVSTIKHYNIISWY